VHGSTADALSKDFLDSDVWKKAAGYIAIARHVDGVCEMAKTWRLKDDTKSMHDYFATYPGRMYVTRDGKINDQHVHADIPATVANLASDPIFGADGGLVFNWYYSNNGARIAVPGSYKSPYDLPGTAENNDDVHGLGNEFGASTSRGNGSPSWWHDVSQKQGDCHGGSCKVVGTDHGSHLHDQACWGQYAIYVSTDASAFECHGRKLTQTIQATACGSGYYWTEGTIETLTDMASREGAQSNTSSYEKMGNPKADECVSAEQMAMLPEITEQELGKALSPEEMLEYGILKRS
jgi:hypothetical protein